MERPSSLDIPRLNDRSSPRGHHRKRMAVATRRRVQSKPAVFKRKLFPNFFSRFRKNVPKNSCKDVIPLSEEAFIDATRRFESKPFCSAKVHPGQKDQILFDRDKPQDFNVAHPPALSSTQIRHLRCMRKNPHESWYRWRMMPIWSLEREDRVVYGAESLFRSVSNSSEAPWMDLVQLKNNRSRHEYIAWKIGEIENARKAVSTSPKLRRVFLNILPIDFLDKKVYENLSKQPGDGLVLELDECKKYWPRGEGRAELFSRLRNLRKVGYQIAIDDIGENSCVDREFIEAHIKDFDYVKFSYKQCATAFACENKVSHGDQNWKKLRREECSKIFTIWQRCRSQNPNLKYVLEFSLTEEITEELGDLFPINVWGSSEWLIQGGISSHHAYPPAVFSGQIYKPPVPRFCMIDFHRVCGWKKRDSFERAA